MLDYLCYCCFSGADASRQSDFFHAIFFLICIPHVVDCNLGFE